MIKIEIPGLGAMMSDLTKLYTDRFPDSQKLFAGGAVAESIMRLWSHIPDHIHPNDLDVFVPEFPRDEWIGDLPWATKACPLNYLKDSAKRKICFLSSARDGFTNWIELETDHIDISDLLDSFDLNVCQAVYEPGGGDTAYVSEAFLDGSTAATITLNPLVALDSRIRKRILKKQLRYGWKS